MWLQREYVSPLGKIQLLVGEDGLRGLWFHHQHHFGKPYQLENIPVGENEMTKRVSAYLDAYFLGRAYSLVRDFPLAYEGSDFKRKILEVVQEIPIGKTMTYQEVAKKIGRGGNGLLLRAVASAIGKNPISIIIPCHRVLGSDGTLVGYAGGLERKRKLLELERVER